MLTDDTLPPSLATVPNVPHSEQTIEQLEAELAYWEKRARTAPGFASAKAADDFRKGALSWLDRRKKEADDAD